MRALTAPCPWSSEGDKLEQVYEELVEKFPGFLGAHVAYLNALDSPCDHKKYGLSYLSLSYFAILFLSFVRFKLPRYLSPIY